MLNHGFYRVAAAVPKLRTADFRYNAGQIKNMIRRAVDNEVEIVCFPELSLTAYTCADLFFQKNLTQGAEAAVQQLTKDTKDLPVTFIIGVPVEYRSKLYNCAAVCREGAIYGIVPKVFLPNYSEFYEKRWFEPYGLDVPAVEINYAGSRAPFGANLLFNVDGARFAVEICEDLWAVVPPSSHHAMAGAQAIFNLSASNELVGKRSYVKSLLSQQSARCHAAYVYASAGHGESSTDLVYTGNAYIYENGRLLAESKPFQLLDAQLIINEIDLELLDAERKKNTTFISRPTVDNYREINICRKTEKKEPASKLLRTINPAPFIPSIESHDESCWEIFSIQMAGLAQRMVYANAGALIVGVSGGLDSTLALLACVKLLDARGLPRKVLHGITMPGFGTSERTRTNAVLLMKALGISSHEISIEAACKQHFKDIGHDPSVHDVTYENAQARERTQILMDMANREKGIVIGTGDLSELALGWMTYGGDHISMYAVNSGIPKTLVRHLVKWVADNQVDDSCRKVLTDILETPVSPELLPVNADGKMTQLTEEAIGPYELHDFFLFYTLRYGFSSEKIAFLAQCAFRNVYDDEEIMKWLEVFYDRFFKQQFKRSCMPDGPKVGSINLSPRGDWRMPSDAFGDGWMRVFLGQPHRVIAKAKPEAIRRKTTA
ncbi:MAG: NAD(+) synthase [Dysgonamonadaceae bacterium]|nr:NAD(+) synthase [Dysgonamonadaceae bacterium]